MTLPIPQAAQALGIVTIYQEFNLIPSMTVEENLFLGREPVRGPFVSWRGMRARHPRAAPGATASICPADEEVRDLSVAQQQMVEIARALSMRSRLIIMDEPTSALQRPRSQRLFAIVRDLQARRDQHHLRHPPPAGGAADLRPGHRAARRQAERQRGRSPGSPSMASSA